MIALGGGNGVRASYVGEGGNLDWRIRSGKSTGKVYIQDGGGAIELLGGGASQSSLIGEGKTQDWYIRSGNVAGTVHIQDKGGPTNVGGAMTVAKDLSIKGKIFLSNGGSTESLEDRFLAMESKMASMMETNARL